MQQINRYSDYGWLRGFSVVPSWGARIEQAWWDYTPARMREEIAPARQVHANCIRLWIDFSAWMADPERIAGNFFDAVDAIDEAGMKTMPCLFNRWHDYNWDYGGVYTEHLYRGWGPMLDYVRALVQPLVRDERILIWDLCNEPQAMDEVSDVNLREIAWLKAIADCLRDCGVLQPITVGTMNGANIDIFAPLCDVLCAHPYAHDRKGLEQLVQDYQAKVLHHGKPLLVNECMPGSLNDHVRAEVVREYAELLSKAGFGWMGWALREGKAISTRRDRYDANGINSEGFHPFFTAAGSLRAGSEFLTEPPPFRAPWQ